MAYPKGWPKCSAFKCGKKAAVFITVPTIAAGRVGYCTDHAPKNGALKGGTT